MCGTAFQLHTNTDVSIEKGGDSVVAVIRHHPFLDEHCETHLFIVDGTHERAQQQPPKLQNRLVSCPSQLDKN